MQQRSGHGNDQPENRCRNDDDRKSSALHGHANMLMDESRSGQQRIQQW
jgi:hypothetical protein